VVGILDRDGDDLVVVVDDEPARAMFARMVAVDMSAVADGRGFVGHDRMDGRPGGGSTGMQQQPPAGWPGVWDEAVPEASEHRQWEARLPIEKWIRNRRVFVHDGVLVRVARFIRNEDDEVVVILDDTPQRIHDRVSKLPRPRGTLTPRW
jgi:hypothetical protein